jgi:hypothetical protein
MNRKGAYSGIIASIAIVVIIAVAFNSSAAVRGGAEQSYSKAIVDVKRDWLNFWYLLSKSASDELADASFVGGSCSYNKAWAQNNVVTYFGNIKTKSFGKECVYSITSQNFSNPVTIDVSITCQKDTSGSSVSYSKNVTFNKNVSASVQGTCLDLVTPKCVVTVTDGQSGVAEVNTNNC